MKGFLVLSICWFAIAHIAYANLPTTIQGIDVVSRKSVELKFDAAQIATVLSFISARCPCSASHEIALKNLHKDFASKGLAFIGVHSNLDESDEITQSHFSESSLPFPVIQDQTNKIANAFGALKTPHVFVVDAKGTVLFQGGIDDSVHHARAKRHFLREVLSAISEGKEPPVREARALGCQIKR